MGAPGLAFETWDPPRKGQWRIRPTFKAHLCIRSEANLSRRAVEGSTVRMSGAPNLSFYDHFPLSS
jgi:hypothetical protein